MNKSVLITGGCGFIGSHLVEYFIKKKFNITVLDKYNIDNNWGHLQKYKNKNNKIRVILGDIRDYDCVFKSVKGNDSVIHLAALGGIPFSYFSPLAYIKTNTEGTYNILEASRNLKNQDRRASCGLDLVGLRRSRDGATSRGPWLKCLKPGPSHSGGRT